MEFPYKITFVMLQHLFLKIDLQKTMADLLGPALHSPGYRPRPTLRSDRENCHNLRMKRL